MVNDCAMKECFTPAVPRSRYCTPHALMTQRVRCFMDEAETSTTSQSTPPNTDSRIHILSTLRDWLKRARQ